jgi:hypothetical protein
MHGVDRALLEQGFNSWKSDVGGWAQRLVGVGSLRRITQSQ